MFAPEAAWPTGDDRNSSMVPLVILGPVPSKIHQYFYGYPRSSTRCGKRVQGGAMLVESLHLPEIKGNAKFISILGKSRVHSMARFGAKKIFLTEQPRR